MGKIKWNYLGNLFLNLPCELWPNVGHFISRRRGECWVRNVAWLHSQCFWAISFAQIAARHLVVSFILADAWNWTTRSRLIRGQVQQHFKLTRLIHSVTWSQELHIYNIYIQSSHRIKLKIYCTNQCPKWENGIHSTWQFTFSIYVMSQVWNGKLKIQPNSVVVKKCW